MYQCGRRDYEKWPVVVVVVGLLWMYLSVSGRIANKKIVYRAAKYIYAYVSVSPLSLPQ